MKLLLDQNISFKLKLALKDYFLSVAHVTDFNFHGKSDLHLWDFAKEQNYSIVSFDMDFYNLSILKGHPPKIIWLRTGNTSTKHISEILILKHAEIKVFLSEPEFEDVSCLQILK